MNKLITSIFAVLVVSCVTDQAQDTTAGPKPVENVEPSENLLSLHFAAKKKFDKARNEINTGILTREIMDAQTRELLTIVRKNWTKHTSEVNGAHSVALKLAGKRPTVSNLVDLFTSRVPEYSFFSLSKNKESAIIASILATLMPITVDGTIHVSSDGSVALIQDSPNSVNIFTDESEGLREELYYIW